MIQLATDPNASRSNWRPAAAEAREADGASRRPRSSHAWPFVARYADLKPGSRETQRTQGSQSGS